MPHSSSKNDAANEAAAGPIRRFERSILRDGDSVAERNEFELPPSADLEHRAVAGRVAFEQVMTGRLELDGASQNPRDVLKFMSRTRAQRSAHVELVVVEKEEVELALGGQPHPVAGAAVRLADQADEAHYTARAREPVVARLVGRHPRRQHDHDATRGAARSIAGSRRSPALDSQEARADSRRGAPERIPELR